MSRGLLDRMPVERTVLIAACVIECCLSLGVGCASPQRPPASVPQAVTTTRDLPLVASGDEIAHRDGRAAVVEGTYMAIPMPTKGRSLWTRPRVAAVVMLDDGTRVFLGAYNDPEFRRPKVEMVRWDGRRVRVSGVVYRVMPSTGQSQISPCIKNVDRIEGAVTR